LVFNYFSFKIFFIILNLKNFYVDYWCLFTINMA